MRLPSLDFRLKAAYDLIEPCENYGDIGADHGLLPLHLAAAGKVKCPLVADISASALQKAMANFERFDVPGEFRLADGLNALNRPMDFISILGMGGDTMVAILQSGQEKLLDAQLVLSPHTDLKRVRQAVSQMGYVFQKETLVLERRRFYVLMLLKKGQAVYTEKELVLGPGLLKENPPLFKDYLLWREKVLKAAGDADLPFVQEALECL